MAGRPSRMRSAAATAAAGARRAAGMCVGRATPSPSRQRRPCTTAQAAPPRYGGDPFAAGPAALLERPAGPTVDAPLWATGAFAGEVYPDLPVAATWRGALRAATGGLLDNSVDDATGDPARPASLIRTVAAQARGRGAVRDRLRAAAGWGAGGGAVPDALLLLAGGHPARSLWAPMGAVGMLQEAASMRAAGELPPSLALWAVVNPLTEPPARAAAKVDAGATVIVTQPPLLWPRWEAWWKGVADAGLPGAARVVAGVALPPTPNALRFWLALAGATSLDGAAATVAAFEAAAAQGAAARAAHARAAAASTLASLASLGPALAGIHVMPVTAGGRALARELVDGGGLEPWARRTGG